MSQICVCKQIMIWICYLRLCLKFYNFKTEKWNYFVIISFHSEAKCCRLETALVLLSFSSPLWYFSTTFLRISTSFFKFIKFWSHNTVFPILMLSRFKQQKSFYVPRKLFSSLYWISLHPLAKYELHQRKAYWRKSCFGRYAQTKMRLN